MNGPAPIQIEKIEKIARLLTSDQDGEALAALRKLNAILGSNGLDMATILCRGLRASIEASQSAAPSGFPDDLFKDFEWGGVKSAKRQQAPDAATSEPGPKAAPPTPKPHRIVDGVPSDPFDARLKIVDDRKTKTGDDWIVVQVTRESSVAIEILPVMSLFGALARKLRDAVNPSGKQPIEALVTARPARNPKYQPTIVSISF